MPSLPISPAVAHAAMFVGTYYFAAFIQTLLHRIFGHHDRIRPVYITHARGHHGKYPPSKLLTDVWLDSEQHVMWYYAIPFAPVAVIILIAFGPWLFFTHSAAMILAIWWHIYLHKQYHLRKSPWERFKWFREKRELHFIHHRQVHKNYAIVEYWMDNLLGTRQQPTTPVRTPIPELVD